MFSAVSQSVNDIHNFLEPLYYELIFASCFIVGWLIVSRLSGWRTSTRGSPPRSTGKRVVGLATARRSETISEACTEGRKDDAIRIWRKVTAPTDPEALRMVAWTMADKSPDSLVEEVARHLAAHRRELCNVKSAVAVLEGLASAGRPDLMRDVCQRFRGDLKIPLNYQVYEALLGAHAAAGDVDRVAELISEVRSIGQKLTARGHALVVKGFLQLSLLDEAIAQAKAMRAQGFYVPPFALGQLFKVASKAGRCPEIFAQMQDADVVLPSEALEVLLEDSAKRGDGELAAKLEVLLRAAAEGKPLPQSSYGALLRAKVAVAHVGALDLFQEVQREEICFGDAYYVSLMALCAEPKFLRFAEELARVLRARSGMLVSTYGALMKVYARCGLFGKACDLYPEILEVGLEPDSVIIVCLMRFAVEAGRNDLLAKLSAKEPHSLQGYMLRIRAAGREKDVEGAFAVLEQMKSAGLAVDALACNCVLDACVNAGDLQRARGLMAEMKKSSLLDTVSFNTMLKGYCSRGDVKASQELFAQLQREGLKPDEVTYNCMINAAVSSGHLRLAWDLARAMEQAGVPMDRFTISILLKAVKGNCAQSDVRNAMALLDRVGLDVCTSDGVLLNVALETCVKHRELRRLQALVSAWERSSLQPSTYTYAALIKAYSSLHRVERCQYLWRQMTEERGAEPSEIVLGCMLDALVSNQMVTEAVTLFRRWKGKVQPNMIIYSTIIKGFAVAGRAQEAMNMWKEIRAEGIAMNVVVYNALIDAQARAGSMDCAHDLLIAMGEDGLSPDSITHSTIVKGFCTAGDLDKAFDVFSSTQKAGLAQDCVIYNTLLDACTKHNRVDLGDRVLADFEVNKVQASNFTLGILVKMYGRRRQLAKAFEVVDEFAKKHRLTPNLQVRSCLMSICINNGALDRALELFEAIKHDSEWQVDAKTCDNVLAGLMRAGRLDECVKFTEDAYGLNDKRSRFLPPGHHLGKQGLDRLVKGLQYKGLEEAVASLVPGLHAAGMSLYGQ